MNGHPPAAYSRLRFLLAERNLPLYQLRRLLTDAGHPLDSKSLDRLNSDDPLEIIDMRLAAAVCQACKVEIDDLITFEKPRAVLQQLSAEKQARLGVLLEKNREAELSDAEKKELDELVEEVQQISVDNAKLLVAERDRHLAKKRSLIESLSAVAA